MSNNHQIEAHIYFGKILRGWDAYEGYKYFHPDTKLTEEEYYSFVENLRYKPGQVVPAAGSNTQAEVFNAACQTDPEDANESKPGRYSHAENINTFAGGEGAHAENIETRAMAYGSHAEGNNTEVKSSAKFGHAGGSGSIVESEAGFAHGVNAVSKNRGEAVFGKNNDPDTTGKSMFQVGIGPNKNNPKTGFQIDSDGTIWVINTNTGSRISLQSWLNDIQLKKIVVDQLPEAGAPSTVYLLRVTAPDESRHNFFEEYIYIDGAWEMLGTSDTDESIIERILSNPAFKVESQQIADNAIQAKHLSEGCVTSDSIQGGAVHNEKIAPKTITHDKIADGAITRDLLAPEVERELDGIQSTVKTTKQNLTETQQEQVFGNLGIKTVFVDSATEIGVALSEERANEIGSALRVVLDYPGVGRLVFSIGLPSAEDYEFYTCASPGYLYNARLNKKSRILRILTLSYLDSTAVKYHPQKLTEEQQEQAFENLGIKTVFVDYETEIGVVLSEERIAEITGATRLVMNVPRKGLIVFHLANVNNGIEFHFVSVQTESDMWCIIANKDARRVTYTSRYFRGYAAVQYIKQQLTDTQKDTARTNIEAQEELSVESKPNGDISIQGLGDTPVNLVPADRLAPYVLKLIASADAPGGYTLEGTTEELEATARSIASNPHARVYLDCSIVTGSPTPIPMSIIMSDAEGGVVYLEADPYIYDSMIQYAGTSELDISVIVAIGPELLQAIVRKSVSEEIKKRLFIDLWNKACGIWGQYNHNTDLFELNGLKDITYNEALEIYSVGPIIGDSLDIWGFGQKNASNIRTNLPSLRMTNTDYKGEYITLHTDAFPWSAKVINLCPKSLDADLFVDDISLSVYTLNNKYFIGTLNLRKLRSHSFDAFRITTGNVEHIHIRELRVNADMQSVGKLDLDSWKFLIREATNTAPITIVVHADVYAKLTGDTTSSAAAALTEEELAQWAQVLTDAMAKNISFATA